MKLQCIFFFFSFLRRNLEIKDYYIQKLAMHCDECAHQFLNEQMLYRVCTRSLCKRHTLAEM